MKYRLFAVTAPGIEPYTAQELLSLGMKPISSHVSSPGNASNDFGGVEFEGSLTDVYRANLFLRSATRLTIRLGEFNAAAFSELRKKASRLPWGQFIKPGQPVLVRAACHKSRLYHSDAVAERVLGAISDNLGKPLQNANDLKENFPGSQLILVRIQFDHVVISIDTSGILLHKRGYHLETAKAPIRETLASTMVLASSWDPICPLIDPFCGSGTIAIEAAMIARQIAPGKNRLFAFMDWPNYNPDLWHSLLEEASAREILNTLIIKASDRDEGAIRIARANAIRAGVEDSIQFTHYAISAIEPTPQPGWIVTNPPYGIRVSPNRDLRNLYSQFGNILRAGFTNWNLGFLCSSDYLAGHTGLEFEQCIPLVNGGLAVKFYQCRL